MPMKRIFATLIFALPLLFCGCSEEEDILPEQRQKIVSYLERTHSPALIPESQVETGSQQRFYTMSGSTVYRYIDNFYRDGRNELPEITAAAKAQRRRRVLFIRAFSFLFAFLFIQRQNQKDNHRQCQRHRQNDVFHVQRAHLVD